MATFLSPILAGSAESYILQNSRTRHVLAAVLIFGFSVAVQPTALAQGGAGSPPAIGQFLSAASPIENRECCSESAAPAR